MTITVIGTGYVGLVAGVCFADVGHKVYCVDKDAGKINKLKKGLLPIYENDLDGLLKKNLRAKRLIFKTSTKETVSCSEVIFLAVGTPGQQDGSPDLSQLLAVARQIAPDLKNGSIVVIKSTVPVGTAERITAEIKQKLARKKTAFSVVSNPEFLKEGNALADFIHPDRVIIGASNSKAALKVADLYKAFVKRTPRILMMDNRSAELTKYACNAFLATKISFINEIANLCEKVGADVEQVRLGMGSDPRIAPYFLYAGTGYGGSCLPKDVKALLHTAKESGSKLEIIQAAETVNQKQKLVLLEKLLKHLKKHNLKGTKIAVWGVAFKPETDDVREAASLEIVKRLLQLGAEIHLHDPAALPNAKRLFNAHKQVKYFQDHYKCLQGCSALFVLTEWNLYKQPDFTRIRRLMSNPVLLDGRNLYLGQDLMQKKVKYFGIGRRDVNLK